MRRRRSLMSKEVFKEKVVFHRGLATTKCCLAMSFAWSSFYATQWLVASWGISGRDITVVSIVTAILVSYVVFVLIRILDMAADSHLLSDIGERAVRRVILAFGTIIGFSWEKSFDISVDAVAAYSPLDTLSSKMLLGAVALILVMPAWRRFIIPMVSEHGYRFGFVPRKVVSRLEHMLAHAEEGGLNRIGEYEEVLHKLASVGGGKYFRLLVTHETRLITKARSLEDEEEDEELVS